jgi:primosomal protein N''
MATIRDNRDYERALQRMNELRGRGLEEEESAELAELEAAVAAYAQRSGKPADTPGRPPLKTQRNGS